jgi:hypothetical protein
MKFVPKDRSLLAVLTPCDAHFGPHGLPARTTIIFNEM